MAGLEIRMEYSGGRTGMIRALAAAQVLAWLITAALLLTMAFVMWKFLAAVSVLSKRTVQPDALHRVLAFVFCAAGGMLGGMTA